MKVKIKWITSTIVGLAWLCMCLLMSYSLLPKLDTDIYMTIAIYIFALIASLITTIPPFMATKSFFEVNE